MRTNSSSSVRTRRRTTVLLVLIGTLSSVAQACLWDWDTLQMERRRFPGVLEMITGKFVRHSPAYYEWRTRDRTRRLRSPDEDPSLADDLAVAYSKLGRHADAISLLEKVLESHPDRYETLANLGTIHMLAGDLQQGKPFIDRAIVINPNAHFGREVYQSELAEYFLTARKTPHPASVESPNIAHSKGEAHGFAAFVLTKRNLSAYASDEKTKEGKEWRAELAAAQKGVLGMMHFANYDSPLLLEALGDLLIAWPTHEEDALLLAARAYYRVAQKSDDETTKDEFKNAAVNVLYGHLDYIKNRDARRPDVDWKTADLEMLSGELDRELADAEAYFATIVADEKRWIEQGIDVDQAFAAKYYDSLDETIKAANKQLATERRDVRGHPHIDAVNRGILVIVVGIVALIATAFGWHYAFHRNRARA